jgi:hypothetical protein
VTVALAGVGGVLGAGLSSGFAAIAGVAIPFVPGLAGAAGAPILVTAGLGAVLGALLTPMTALSLLRQVALGKALLFTMLGMSLGVSVTHQVLGRPGIAAAAGVGGFLTVALLLRLTSRTRRSEAPTKGPKA